MTERPRRPEILGLTPGAGASTLAAALHAADGGLLPDGQHGRGADVVVCTSADTSVRRAESLVCPAAGPRPVLAVTLAASAAAPAIAARLRPRFDTVVLLPHVERWSGIACPDAEAAAVLARPDRLLPGPLRQYAAALRLIVTGLVASGQLLAGAPPTVTGPRSMELWRGLQPVERRAPLPAVLISTAERCTPVRLASARPLPPPVDPSPQSAGAELDDEAIEADQGQAPVAATG